jgi:hypothetical protein
VRSSKTLSSLRHSESTHPGQAARAQIPERLIGTCVAIDKSYRNQCRPVVIVHNDKPFARTIQQHYVKLDRTEVGLMSQVA